MSDAGRSWEEREYVDHDCGLCDLSSVFVEEKKIVLAEAKNATAVALGMGGYSITSSDGRAYTTLYSVVGVR